MRYQIYLNLVSMLLSNKAHTGLRCKVQNVGCLSNRTMDVVYRSIEAEISNVTQLQVYVSRPSKSKVTRPHSQLHASHLLQIVLNSRSTIVLWRVSNPITDGR